MNRHPPTIPPHALDCPSTRLPLTCITNVRGEVAAGSSRALVVHHRMQPVLCCRRLAAAHRRCRSCLLLCSCRCLRRIRDLCRCLLVSGGAAAAMLRLLCTLSCQLSIVVLHYLRVQRRRRRAACIRHELNTIIPMWRH